MKFEKGDIVVVGDDEIGRITRVRDDYEVAIAKPHTYLNGWEIEVNVMGFKSMGRETIEWSHISPPTTGSQQTFELASNTAQKLYQMKVEMEDMEEELSAFRETHNKIEEGIND